MRLSNKFNHGDEVVLVKPPTYGGERHPAVETRHPDWQTRTWFINTVNQATPSLPHPGDYTIISTEPDAMSGYFVMADEVALAYPPATPEDIEAAVASILTRPDA